MYFSSEEYEINDEEGRFVCSLVFIVKNKSGDNFDSTEFNEKVWFTVSFLVNNFLLSLFRDCQEGNEIVEKIKLLNKENTSCHESFFGKKDSKDISSYSIISLDSLGKETEIVKKILDSKKDQIISNMSYFLERFGKILEYYNDAQKFLQRKDSSIENLQEIQSIIRSQKIELGLIPPILDLPPDWLSDLLLNQIECVFCFDSYGKTVQNFYVKDKKEIPNIRESFSAVSISKRKSKKIVPGRNRFEIMASICLNMIEIDPNFWKYFRFYIGKGTRENLVSIDSILESADVPFLIFYPPSHPNHAFLGLLDVNQSKNIKHNIKVSFENSKEMFKEAFKKRKEVRKQFFIKSIVEKKEYELRKTLIPENYEEVELEQMTNTGGKKCYFLRPKKIISGSKIERKQVEQVDLAKILFYRLYVEEKDKIPQDMPMFCPIITRLDSSGAGNSYKFSEYEMGNAHGFAKKMSERFGLTTEDNILTIFLAPPKPASFFVPESHNWPQGTDNFQGDYAGTCSYFADADIYSFGIVLYNLFSQIQTANPLFNDILEIKKDPGYQLFLFKNMLDRISSKQDLLKIVDADTANTEYDKKFFEIVKITKHNCLLINKTRFPSCLMSDEEISLDTKERILENMTIDGSIPIHLTFNVESFIKLTKEVVKKGKFDHLFGKMTLPNDDCSRLMDGITYFPGKDYYSYNTYKNNEVRLKNLIDILSKKNIENENKDSKNKKLLIIEILKLNLFLNSQNFLCFRDKKSRPKSFLTYSSNLVGSKVLATYFTELARESNELFKLTSIYNFEKQIFRFNSNDDKLTVDDIDRVFNAIVPEVFRKIKIHDNSNQSHFVDTDVESVRTVIPNVEKKTRVDNQHSAYSQKRKVTPTALVNKSYLPLTKTQSFKWQKSQLNSFIERHNLKRSNSQPNLSFREKEELKKQKRTAKLLEFS